MSAEPALDSSQPIPAPAKPPAVSEPAGDVITLDLITRTLPQRSLFSYLIYLWMHRFTASGRVMLVLALVVFEGFGLRGGGLLLLVAWGGSVGYRERALLVD